MARRPVAVANGACMGGEAGQDPPYRRYRRWGVAGEAAGGGGERGAHGR
jgi:hypothetical protein